MAKKKVTKKTAKSRSKKTSKVKTAKSHATRKTVKVSPRKSMRRVHKVPGKVQATKRKIILVLSKLLFFAGLSLVSFVLYLLLSNAMLKNLFSLLAMIFGFVSVGFLIVLLIFLVLRFLRK